MRFFGCLVLFCLSSLAITVSAPVTAAQATPQTTVKPDAPAAAAQTTSPAPAVAPTAAAAAAQENP
ncbi:MAG: hypothetical protein ABSF17_16665, partial [Terracidiphilus sp.]